MSINSKVRAKIAVSLKDNGYEMDKDYTFTGGEFVFKDMDTAKSAVDDVAGVFRVGKMRELPDGRVSVMIVESVDNMIDRVLEGVDPEKVIESDEYILYPKFEWDRNNLKNNPKWLAFVDELAPAAPKGYQNDKNGIWSSRKAKVTGIGSVDAYVSAPGFDTFSRMIKSIGFTYLKPIGTYMDGTAYKKGDTVIGVDDNSMAIGILK